MPGPDGGIGENAGFLGCQIANSAPGGGAPFDGGWQLPVQDLEPLPEPDPIVAEPFRFAPAPVAADVTLAAKNISNALKEWRG
jgi:hypothetical protein